MLQHAFLMMVHKSPELVYRICKVLEAPNHHFFIHVDPKSREYKEITSLRGIKNLNFIDSMPVYHSRVSLVYCELALYESAYASGTHFDYFHLISGQDYPLRTNKQFDEFFETHDGESYAGIEEDNYHNQCMANKKYPLRVDVYYLNRRDTLLSKVLEHFTPRIQLWLHLRSPLKEVWGGWQWKSLHRSVVKYVLRYVTDNPSFLRRFNYTLCADELYFQTLVHGHEKELRINGNQPLRYVSWVPTHPVDTKYRPYTLDERDFKPVIESQAFFCRKVDLPVSLPLLDMIDEQRGSAFDFGAATPILG